MSKLYNYFVGCWTLNPNFTAANLENAVTKTLLTADEKAEIESIPR